MTRKAGNDNKIRVKRQSYGCKSLVRVLFAFVIFTAISHLAAFIKTFSWSEYLEPVEFKDNPRQDDFMMKKMRSYYESDWRLRRVEAQLKILNPFVPGWGEGGDGVALEDPDQARQVKKQWSRSMSNNYIAERISMNRTLFRPAVDECYNITYELDKLPTASVVIIFHNEIFPVLMRTVWSVINRTPKSLLKEIILVDDDSDYPELKSILSDYIRLVVNSVPRHERFLRAENGPLVKLVRMPQRGGLIKARLMGAKRASGDVLQFLDAHCEVTELWLEPVLQRIRQNRRVFVIPELDEIGKTMRYLGSKTNNRNYTGGFTFFGSFDWDHQDLSKLANVTPVDPIPYYAMQGGLFGVDRKFFFEIGSYDEEMTIWGAENLEMSFRVWQCGGRIESHPCSRVGHIARTWQPYLEKEYVGFNWHRTVHVWMDQYKDVAIYHSSYLRAIQPGNFEARLKLRQELKCRDFDWYLQQVYGGLKFVYNRNVRAYGRVSNPHTKLCLDTLKGAERARPVGLAPCRRESLRYMTSQYWSLTNKGQLRRESCCLAYETNTQSNSGIIDKYDKKNTSPLTRDQLNLLTFQNVVGMYFHTNLTEIVRLKQNVHTLVESIGTLRKRHSVYMHTCVHDAGSRSPNFRWHWQLVNETKALYLVMNNSFKKCLTTKQYLDEPKSVRDRERDKKDQSLVLFDDCNPSDPHQHWHFQINFEDPNNLDAHHSPV